MDELITKLAIEHHQKEDLSRSSRLDIRRDSGIAGLVLVPKGLDNELGNVIRSDETPCWVKTSELHLHCLHCIDLAALAQPDVTLEAADLVNQEQELEPEAVRHGVEWKAMKHTR